MGLAEDAGLEKGSHSFTNVREKSRIDMKHFALQTDKEGPYSTLGSRWDLLHLYSGDLRVFNVLPKIEG